MYVIAMKCSFITTSKFKDISEHIVTGNSCSLIANRIREGLRNLLLALNVQID